MNDSYILPDPIIILNNQLFLFILPKFCINTEMIIFKMAFEHLEFFSFINKMFTKKLDKITILDDFAIIKLWSFCWVKNI